MSSSKPGENIIYGIVKSLLAVPELTIPETFTPTKILIVRQHNQLGDMLAGVSLFRGIKEKYPECSLTVIAGPQNDYAIEKNRFIDTLFTFNKKKLLNPFYLSKLYRILRNKYDFVIVPVTVSISFTSNLLSRFSDAKYRIGPLSLDGWKNKSAFLFNIRVPLDWRRQPDSNVAERVLDIVKPLQISASTLKSEITFTEKDVESAKKFIHSLQVKDSQLLIGFHVGAGKPQNRWSLIKYIKLIAKLNRYYDAKFYFTGSKTDHEEINYVRDNLSIPAGYFLDKKIPEVAALISLSDLFISNDTGIMHVAGTTSTPLIAIFGPTNPYNWAPVGENKYFLRRSELIDDVEMEDVLGMSRMILDKKAGSAEIG